MRLLEEGPPTTGTDLFAIPPEKLFSPSVSQLFYEMAYEISHGENITNSQTEQAIVLLNAAMELDSSASFATADMLEIMSRPGPQRHLQMLYDALIKYTDKNADLLVAANAAKYLLNQLDSRQQRETLLRRMIQDIGESNLFRQFRTGHCAWTFVCREGRQHKRHQGTGNGL